MYIYMTCIVTGVMSAAGDGRDFNYCLAVPVLCCAVLCCTSMFDPDAMPSTRGCSRYCVHVDVNVVTVLWECMCNRDSPCLKALTYVVGITDCPCLVKTYSGRGDQLITIERPCQRPPILETQPGKGTENKNGFSLYVATCLEPGSWLSSASSQIAG